MTGAAFNARWDATDRTSRESKLQLVAIFDRTGAPLDLTDTQQWPPRRLFTSGAAIAQI